MGTHVAVVGAGIIGASAAWRLLQAGHRVTLLDAGAMGAEASYAAAGMLAPGAEVEGESSWSALALEGARTWPEFVAELKAESGEPIDFRAGGALEVAAGDEEAAAIERRAARQAALGIRSHWCDPADLARLAPGACIPPGGRVRCFPGDAIVDPREVVRALRVACLRRGAAIQEHSGVSAIEWHGGEAVIALGNGVLLRAGAAILAAGAWSSRIPLRVDGAIVELPESYPVRGHMLGYRLAPGLLGSILRHGHTYLLQRSHGYFIVGATSETAGFDRTPDSAAIAGLRRSAEALFGPLRGQTPEMWLGFRPATRSGAPQIRRVDGARIWLAYGHYRNGILMAPPTARRVADQVDGMS